MKKILMCLVMTTALSPLCLAASGPVISEGPVVAPPFHARIVTCFNTEIQDRCELAATNQLRPLAGAEYEYMVATVCGPQRIVEHFLVQTDRTGFACKVTQLTESFIPESR